MFKKRGKLHLYINYQALNQLTRKDYTLLPLISKILDYLLTSKVFTKLDLYNIYH